jgi:nucleotide-binding universal stress UspA family protein
MKVLNYAVYLAKSLSCKILLVSVANIPDSEPDGVSAFEKAENDPDAYAEYLEGVSEEITDKYTDVLQKAGIQSRALTPSGNAAADILEVADEENVKLIVVGLKGLHGLEKIRSLGSVARRVIENSTRPVVVVP